MTDRNIKPGAELLLDGNTAVTVIKAVSRSHTSFIVKTPNGSIVTVEKERLRPFIRQS